MNMQYYGQYEQKPNQYYNEENISITLDNQDLWNQFRQITNEMIVTKVGRRMFPIISIIIRGLDPEKMYTVELSFDQIDPHRWRYVNSEWHTGTKPDPPTHRPTYQHPDSPNYGRTWMKDIISFAKVKLTNKIDHTGPSQVILNSLHKHRPRISIIDIAAKEKIYETSFNETEFIAVTAYQNEEVRALKIRYNPFAKAFLDTGTTKRELIEEQSNNGPMFYSQESSSGGPDRLKLESYRSSPYNYPRMPKKSSPTNSYVYPSSSTSPFDLSTFYPSTPTTNIPCSSPSPFLLTDNTSYYANSYYPPTSSYYFPYGTSQPTPAPYPFITSFNYPLNNNPSQETPSFFYMQPPMPVLSNDNNNQLNSLLPINNESEEY